MSGAPPDLSGPDIHERLPGEPAKAFGWFEAFCRLGPGRTVKELAENAKRTPQHFYRLASTWQWGDRALSYDRARRRKLDADVHEQLVRVHLMELANSRGFFHWVGRFLTAMTDEKLEAMKPNEIARWAQVASALARGPLGEPDQRIALGTVGEDGGFRPIAAMSEAERRAELGSLLADIGARVAAGEVIEDEDALLAFLAIPPPRSPVEDSAGVSTAAPAPDDTTAT